jgi:hypothetical protein
MVYFIRINLYITFQVVFLHPVHNYALVAYDPSALGAVGASMVRAAELLPGRLTSCIFSSILSLTVL